MVIEVSLKCSIKELNQIKGVLNKAYCYPSGKNILWLINRWDDDLKSIEVCGDDDTLFDMWLYDNL